MLQQRLAAYPLVTVNMVDTVTSRFVQPAELVASRQALVNPQLNSDLLDRQSRH